MFEYDPVSRIELVLNGRLQLDIVQKALELTGVDSELSEELKQIIHNNDVASLRGTSYDYSYKIEGMDNENCIENIKGSLQIMSVYKNSSVDDQVTALELLTIINT
ncbi:MAG: hypothetical protein NVSMB46_08990 [Candidatus Saccharimonadales bacterium]